MRTGLWAAQTEDFCDALESRLLTGPLAESGWDASVFLHGICGIFALALHDRFGYSICFCTDESGDEGDGTFQALVHVYCVDLETDSVIDVRGITDDTDEFLEEFADFLGRDYIEVNISREDCECELRKMIDEKGFADCYNAATAYIETYADDFIII